jgi:hypothetical protein
LTQTHSGRASFETTITRYRDEDFVLTAEEVPDCEEVELTVTISGSSFYSPATRSDPEDGEVDIDTICVIDPPEWEGVYVELTSVERESVEMEMMYRVCNPTEDDFAE